VNETLLKKLGIRDPKEAIGKELNFWDGGKVANIVGVIRDFNSYSLRQPMAPVVLSTWKDVYQTINIKMKPGSETSVLSYVEKLWNEAFPDYVYEYKFLDETIANFYKQESQLSQLYKIFAAIAIFLLWRFSAQKKWVSARYWEHRHKILCTCCQKSLPCLLLLLLCCPHQLLIT
jgi:hypothetical protein